MKKINTFIMVVLILLGGCSIKSNKDEGTIKDENIINSEQTDYVSLLQEKNSSSKQLKAQIIGDRTFWIYQPVSYDKYIGHFFEKNKNDDFILYSSSVVGMIKDNSFTPEQYIMAGSNKEFAYFAKPNNSSGNFHWFPEHSNIGTAFAKKQEIIFDGIVQDSTQPGDIIEIDKANVRQNLEFVYPETGESLAAITIETTVDSKGVTYNAQGKWLQDTYINKGYVAMLPTLTPLMKVLHTSTGNKYELKLKEGKTDILEGESTSSYAYMSDQLPNQPYIYILAENINAINDTLRTNLSGRRKPFPVWLEHRNDGAVQKIYPQVYENHIAKKDELFSFSATIYTGLLPSSKKLQ